MCNVLYAVTIKLLFRDVSPCSLVETYEETTAFVTRADKYAEGEILHDAYRNVVATRILFISLEPEQAFSSHTLINVYHVLPQKPAISIRICFKI